MKYKLLALDIDGTLTNSQKIITEKTKSALIKAQENGIKIILASGRPTYGIVPLAEQLELKRFGGFILTYNGGNIINYRTGEMIFQQSLKDNLKKKIYDISKEFGINVLTYDKDTIITENADKYTEKESLINGMLIKTVKSFTESIKLPVTKYLMTGDGDYLATVEPIIRKRLKGSANVFRSEPFFLEIVPENLDKAYSLGKLLETVSVKKEELVACGDGFNDKSMIAFAGLGVAMENAQDEVKEIADVITLSNDNDGIAYVVEKFILSESKYNVDDKTYSSKSQTLSYN